MVEVLAFTQSPKPSGVIRVLGEEKDKHAVDGYDKMLWELREKCLYLHKAE